MNGTARDGLGEPGRRAVFPLSRLNARKLAALALALLALAASIEFFVLGLARRTFLFYTVDTGAAAVESRMLRVSREGAAHSPAREVDIARYVEEALLGPAAPNSLPLFPRETRLLSLLYRDGVVFAGLSEDAALPLAPGGEVFASLEALYSGIKRNFPFVRDVRFFIAGKAAYAGKFR